MAYSHVAYTGDGTNAIFNIPFPFLKREFITVNINGIQQPPEDIEWLTDASIRLVKTPPAGSSVLIFRDTAKDKAVVDFRDGSVLTERALDDQVTQLLHITQEVYDVPGQLQSTLEGIESVAQEAADQARLAGEKVLLAQEEADRARAEADRAESSTAEQVTRIQGEGEKQVTRIQGEGEKQVTRIQGEGNAALVTIGTAKGNALQEISSEVQRATAEADRAKTEADRASAVTGIDVATYNRLGLVMVGSGLEVDTYGVLSGTHVMNTPGLTLPTEISNLWPTTISLVKPTFMLQGTTVQSYEVTITGVGSVSITPDGDGNAEHTFQAVGAPGSMCSVEVYAKDSLGNRSQKASGTAVITTAFVEAPTITSPSAGSSLAMAPFDATTSPFTSVGYVDSHHSTEWKATRDEGGLDVVYSAVVSEGDLTKHTFPALEVDSDQTRYIWVRHVGTTLGASSWTSIPVTALRGYVETPSITYPTSGAELEMTSFAVTATPFTSVGKTDVHVSTDWKATTDAAGLDVVYSEYDSEDLTSHYFQPLMVSDNSDRYIWCRYTGAALGKSEWAVVRVIATPVVQDVVITTSGSYTIKTPGTYDIHVIGGGGGGGCGGWNWRTSTDSRTGYTGGAGGGGGSGGSSITRETLQAGQILNVVIGAGGTGGNPSPLKQYCTSDIGSPGGAGGDTKITGAVTVSVGGGKGGSPGRNASATAVGANGQGGAGGAPGGAPGMPQGDGTAYDGGNPINAYQNSGCGGKGAWRDSQNNVSEWDPDRDGCHTIYGSPKTGTAGNAGIVILKFVSA